MEDLMDWLQQWEIWLDEALVSGLAHMGSSTRQKISLWARSAEDLGFASEAAMAMDLLKIEQPLEVRTRQLCNILVRHSLLAHLIHIDTLRSSIAAAE